MKKFWGNLKIFYRNCERTRKIYKTSGEVSKNFENITRNFEENFGKKKVNFEGIF